jgi:hypothetical protein
MDQIGPDAEEGVLVEDGGASIARHGAVKGVVDCNVLCGAVELGHEVGRHGTPEDEVAFLAVTRLLLRRQVHQLGRSVWRGGVRRGDVVVSVGKEEAEKKRAEEQEQGGEKEQQQEEETGRARHPGCRCVLSVQSRGMMRRPSG